MPTSVEMTKAIVDILSGEVKILEGKVARFTAERKFTAEHNVDWSTYTAELYTGYGRLDVKFRRHARVASYSTLEINLTPELQIWQNGYRTIDDGLTGMLRHFEKYLGRDPGKAVTCIVGVIYDSQGGAILIESSQRIKNKERNGGNWGKIGLREVQPEYNRLLALVLEALQGKSSI